MADAPNLVAGLHHIVLQFFFEYRADAGNPVLVRGSAPLQKACHRLAPDPLEVIGAHARRAAA